MLVEARNWSAVVSNVNRNFAKSKHSSKGVLGMLMTQPATPYLSDGHQLFKRVELSRVNNYSE